MKPNHSLCVVAAVLAVALLGASLNALRYPARVTPAAVVSTGPILPTVSTASMTSTAGVMNVAHADTVNNFQGFLTDTDRVELMRLARDAAQVFIKKAK